MQNAFFKNEANGRNRKMEASVKLDLRHRVYFTQTVFSPSNSLLAKAIENAEENPSRVAFVLDQGVVDCWPEMEREIEEYCALHSDVMTLAAPPMRVEGGEISKNDPRIFQDLIQYLHDAKMCRRSYVAVVGGGALLDSAGFAASTVHRGVRLIRMPTTTLGQGDSGVGVKNGINAVGKKNFLGTFDVPHAIINDQDFLTTLSDRDWRCGFSEAIKVALIKNEKFFRQILEATPRINARDLSLAGRVVRDSARVHWEHIVHGGDPFELTIARPLDFGHWAAHKLEQMTEFRLRHGEAVAIGIAIDVAYSALTGRLSWEDAETIRNSLVNLGFSLQEERMLETDVLLDGLEEFREHLGGRLAITLLAGIGQPFEVSEIDRGAMAKAIECVALDRIGPAAG